MPKPRKNTRAATRSRPRGRNLLPSLNFKGVIDGVVAVALKALALVKRCGGLALAATWKSRAARRSVALAAGVAVCAALSWVMLGNLRGQTRFQVDPGRIELAAEPTWARPELASRIKREIETNLRRNLAQMEATDVFDGDLPEVLALELGRSVWVRNVVRVERHFPNGPEGASQYLTVLEVRRPAVLVEQGERVVAVDGEGFVLPLAVSNSDIAGFQDQLFVPLRLVKGVGSLAPEPGKPWRNEQINAALSMETILRKSELDRSIPIAAIELVGVPEQPDSRGRVHYSADGGVMLWPDQSLFPGARLIWGRPPVHASTLEASPNDKLNELKKKLEQPPEALVGTRIDLRRRVS